MDGFFIKADANADYLATHFEENFDFSNKISTIDNILKLKTFLKEFCNSSELFEIDRDDYDEDTAEDVLFDLNDIRDDIETMYDYIHNIHSLMLQIITLISELRHLKDQN
jgi:hypothetical protein